MHPQFVDLLACPNTGAALALKATETSANGLVVSGELMGANGVRYPIVRGIPRFVAAEQYASSFGYEWSRWPRVQFEAENDGRPMAGHTTRMWETITGGKNVGGNRIVEFGCGPGRFLDVLRRKGGQAVGVDLSLAVEAARRNFADDPEVLIVQADVLNPPFRPGSFDGGYSIGVLHHTPAPERGMSALARVVAPGGWVACCVYPKGEFYDYAAVRRWRRLHLRLKRLWGYGPALAYAYLSAYLLAPVLCGVGGLPGIGAIARYVGRQWLPYLCLPDVRWRLLDTFDAITPEIATTHTADEVRGWLRDADCVDLHPTSWCPTSWVGMRSKARIKHAG